MDGACQHGIAQNAEYNGVNREFGLVDRDEERRSQTGLLPFNGAGILAEASIKGKAEGVARQQGIAPLPNENRRHQPAVV